MRLTTGASSLWKNCGLGAGDIAALVNCDIEESKHCLSLWADKIYKRERGMRKELELEQGSEAWHAFRKKGVGASEVASVVGAAYSGRNGTKTSMNLFEEKVSTVKGDSENADIRRGRQGEAPARKLYEDLYGWSVPAVCVVHDEYDFIRASLDGLRSDDKLVVEIKCPGNTNHRKMLECQYKKDPLERQTLFCKFFNYYRYQVLYQLLITQADVCHFISYSEDKSFSGEQRMAVIELYPEPKEQQRLLEMVVEFWDYVEKREPPDIEMCLPRWEWPSELKVTE